MQALGTADEIRDAVRMRYSQVAREPEGQYNFRVGRAFAEALGYPASLLEELPASVTAAFTGVACPSLLADARPGQTVVDLGSGGGLDLVVLARKVGPVGRAIGVDFALVGSGADPGATPARRDHAPRGASTGFAQVT